MCTPGNDLSMDIAARRPSESFCVWRSTLCEVRRHGTHNTAAVHMAATHKVQHVQQAIRKELRPTSGNSTAVQVGQSRLALQRATELATAPRGAAGSPWRRTWLNSLRSPCSRAMRA